jgi:hypothetical protein
VFGEPVGPNVAIRHAGSGARSSGAPRRRAFC